VVDVEKVASRLPNKKDGGDGDEAYGSAENEPWDGEDICE
jgi:hypothetical protein